MAESFKDSDLAHTKKVLFEIAVTRPDLIEGILEAVASGEMTVEQARRKAGLKNQAPGRGKMNLELGYIYRRK
ncbi:MAG: hypothetical protein AB1491_01350 [Thermodesulfobacteriota bacterium]